MNKETRQQGRVPFVLVSAATAAAFLLINLKYSCALCAALPALAAGWLTINHRDLLIRVGKTLPRDAKIIKDYLTYFIKIKIWNLFGYNTYAKIFKKFVVKHPNKIAFKHEDSLWRYIEVEEFSNQIANYFKQQGLKRGDVVALFMESCPEYVCIWLGLSKIGVTVALINNNLRGIEKYKLRSRLSFPFRPVK